MHKAMKKTIPGTEGRVARIAASLALVLTVCAACCGSVPAVHAQPGDGIGAGSDLHGECRSPGVSTGSDCTENCYPSDGIRTPSHGEMAGAIF